MTFVKTTLAVSTALLLVSAPVAFSAESATTANGGPGTQMKGTDKAGMESGRSVDTNPTGTDAGTHAQNNRGPDRTGPIGGSHNGP